MYLVYPPEFWIAIVFKRNPKQWFMQKFGGGGGGSKVHFGLCENGELIFFQFIMDFKT